MIGDAVMRRREMRGGRKEAGDEFLEHWLTIRGIKAGDIPNKLSVLYNAYRRHTMALQIDLGIQGATVLSPPAFSRQLRDLGLSIKNRRKLLKRQEYVTVTFLNKAVAPKSAIS